LMFWCYYDPQWDHWLRAGIIVLACYGLYEILFDLAFGRSGDFLTNRTFEGGSFSGSLVQRHHLFGVPLMRIKSLTGEASMYSLTVIPYLALALQRRWVMTSLLLISTLILTVSTTGYIGLMLVGMLALVRWAKARQWRIAVQAWAVGSIAVLVIPFFNDAFSVLQHVFVEKLTGADRSGAARRGAFEAALQLWQSGSLFTQLCGIGFGYIRSTDLLSTLLVNIGLIGLLLWIFGYARPGWRLIRSGRALDWRVAATLVPLLVMLAGVPEFAYLAPWAFLGIAYRMEAEIADAPPATSTGH
jgi:hypothetical protein